MLSRTSAPHLSRARSCAGQLSIDICRDADTLVVTPVGEADVCTVPELRQALDEVTGSGRSQVLVDLDRLAFMDASVLGVLVDARRHLSASGGTLKVRCLTPQRRWMLTVTGLDDMLERSA